MIKVIKYRFGNYYQKLVIEDAKILNVECTCIWGKMNQKAWKEGKPICKHIQNAIMHENLKRKKYHE